MHIEISDLWLHWKFFYYSRTVVTVNIGKSQALHTTVKRRGKGHNSALVSIGEIDVDIPQHPVVLHGMLTRGTTQLSSTLQEFRRPIQRTRWELCFHIVCSVFFCEICMFKIWWGCVDSYECWSWIVCTLAALKYICFLF